MMRDKFIRFLFLASVNGGYLPHRKRQYEKIIHFSTKEPLKVLPNRRGKAVKRDV